MANYNYVLELMSTNTENLKNDHPMQAVVSRLKELNRMIQDLNRQEEEIIDNEVILKPKPMTTKQFDTLLTAYHELQKSARKAHVEGGKDKNYQYLDEMMRMVNRDLEALNHADKRQLSDYHSMVDDSALYTADIRKKQLNGVGGACSCRYPLSVSNGKGGYIDGYFTMDSRLNPNVAIKEAILDAAEECREFNKPLSEALKKVSGDAATIKLIHDVLYKQNKRYEDNVLNLQSITNAWTQVLSPRDKINLSHYDIQILGKMANAINKISFEAKFMRDTAHVRQGGVIGQRNAAMTAVADYLGVPNLIARSNQISVLTGETENGSPVYKTGIFMEKVNGIPMCDVLKKNSYLIQDVGINENTFYNDIANLQVLDYICGNVDRHAGNYLLKSNIKNGVQIFTGIVGIDNDTCFGELPTDSDTHCLRAPAHMGYITNEMAERVKNITKGDLQQVLSGFGIRNSEVSQAWERTQALQKAIKQGKIKIFPGNKLKNGEPDLASFDKANRIKAKDSSFEGIGSTSNHVFSTLRSTYDTIGKFRDHVLNILEQNYREQNDMSDAEAIPPEEEDYMQKAAQYTAYEMNTANQDLNVNGRDFKKNLAYVMKNNVTVMKKISKMKSPLKSLGTLNNLLKKKAITKAEYDNIMSKARMDYLDQNVMQKAYNNFTNYHEEDILKDGVLVINDKYATVKDSRQGNNLSDRAARLAAIEAKLKDAMAEFDETNKSHGKSPAYRDMYDSLNRLMEGIQKLKSSEFNQNGEFKSEDWETFKKMTRETFEHTCYYIFRKPLNPVHDYGKKRLDTAHELRSQVFDALQMTDTEISAHMSRNNEKLQELPGNENKVVNHVKQGDQGNILNRY